MFRTKISLFLFVAGLILMFSACSKSNAVFTPDTIPPSFEATLTESNTTVQYQFSVVYSEKGNSQQYVIPNYADAADRGIYTRNIYYEDLELKDCRVNIPGTSIIATYEYSYGSAKDRNSNDLGSFYCIYDCYRSDGGDVVEYLHGTDILAFISLTSNRDNPVQLVDEAKARKIAEDFIVDAIGLERFQKMEFLRVNTDAVGRYAVSYRRSIEGYKTDETIAVFIDKGGNLSAYNGFNIGKYDAVPYLPAKAEIDAANKILNDTVNSLGLSIAQTYSPCLITNTAGEVFLEMGFKYTVNDGSADNTWADTIIININ